MNAMTILLLTASFVSPPVDNTDPSRLRSWKDSWNEMHAGLSAEKPTINAFIVLDPREEAIWIEKDGKVDPDHVRSLPRGMIWSAFYFGEDGVAEIKFPVRVRRYYSSNLQPRPDEMVWVQGASKSGNWQWEISAGSNGGKGSSHGMGWGTGTGGKETLTISRPQLGPGKSPTFPANSMLQQSTPQPPRFADHFPGKWFEVNVKRTTGKN